MSVFKTSGEFVTSLVSNPATIVIVMMALYMWVNSGHLLIRV